MAITNVLDVTFDFSKIDAAYDIFRMTTSEKYIPRGAYVLDKPQIDLKSLSLVFDNNRSAFVLFKKGTISQQDLASQLGDEKLSFDHPHPSAVKPYILFRLFLYSLNNYQSDENAFNNLTGRLFLCRPGWIKKNGESLLALCFDVGQDMTMTCEASTFTSLSVFKKSKRVQGSDYAKYVLLPNGKLKRTLVAGATDKIYVKKGLPGRKAEYPFFDLRPEKVAETKCFWMYRVLQLLNQRYGSFVKASFGSITKVAQISERLDSDFLDRAVDVVKRHPLIAVDLVQDDFYNDDFQDVVLRLERALCIDAQQRALTKNGASNIVFLHEKDYYNQDDPYKSLSREQVIQCVTAEDSVQKIISSQTSVINTIIKELAIKWDLTEGSISLDDWSTFGFSSDYVFAVDMDKERYFMRVHPDGCFEMIESGTFGGFHDPEIQELSDLMDGFNLKGKTLVADDRGNAVLISRTSRFCLPSPDVFGLKTISRSKGSRNQYLDGVVDINLFAEESRCFYSAGLVGNGMNTGIPKASLLYEVTVVKGRNIIADILATMSVMFVKYNSFTVLPYPVKYLREYIAAHIQTDS